MNLLQKLTIDWLRALGSWLWANFVVATMAFLDRLTFRRMVFYVGILIIAMAATQLMSIDLAIIFAGDAMFYFEIASAVCLVAARGHVRQALQIAVRVIRQAVQNLPNTFRGSEAAKDVMITPWIAKGAQTIPSVPTTNRLHGLAVYTPSQGPKFKLDTTRFDFGGYWGLKPGDFPESRYDFPVPRPARGIDPRQRVAPPGAQLFGISV